MEEATTEAGLQEVENYVTCRQNTVEQFIETRPIMHLCLAAEHIPGPRISKQRWEKDGVDAEGMRTEAWEAERTEGEEETDGTETDTD